MLYQVTPQQEALGPLGPGRDRAAAASSGPDMLWMSRQSARDGLMPSFHRAAPPGNCTTVSGQKPRSGLWSLAGHHGLVGDDDDGVIGQIREIVLDSPDPWALAAFWAGLLGGAPFAVVSRLGDPGATPAWPAAFVSGQHRRG